MRRDHPAKMRLISPKIVPIHSGLWKKVNGPLLRRQLDRWVKSEEPRVLWTYTPVTYDMELLADATVYHCVDLLGEFPGIDRQAIDEGERLLAERGVVAIASSNVVADHLQRQGFETVHLWPNVADVTTIIDSAGEIVGSNRAGAVFAGNFTDKKVDFSILTSMIDSGIQLHLAGPLSEGGGDTNAIMNEFIARGAIYHGVLSLEDLSNLMGECRVGLIPYVLNSYTMGVSPLKTYEYLAAGLGVVSTAVPGVASVPGDVEVELSNQCFVESVRTLHDSFTYDRVLERRRVARLHGWEERGSNARVLVEGLLSSSARDAAQGIQR